MASDDSPWKVVEDALDAMDVAFVVVVDAEAQSVADRAGSNVQEHFAPFHLSRTTTNAV